MVVNVWDIEDTGYLVRGTDNPREARRVAWEHACGDGHYEPVDVRHFVKRVRMVPGWYRCNPCWCGMGHRFDIGNARGPGRGNFRGVLVEL